MWLSLVLACAGPDDSGAPDSPGATCDVTEAPWGEGGADMLPGTDCLACHVDGGRAADAPLTAAGTVFAAEDCPDVVEGATVTLTDAQGVTITLTTGPTGNFSTDVALTPPLSVRVETPAGAREMGMAAPSGACGSCHVDGDFVWVER